MALSKAEVREVQRDLIQLGWPIQADGTMGERTHRALRHFQQGFAWWWLLDDGYAGRKTRRALQYAVNHGGRCSPHYAFKEFTSKGNGWIRCDRALIRGLEAYRDELDGPVVIVSGYRDPAYNASLDGAADNSQHVYGNAVDLAPRLPLAKVVALGRFSGIGYQSQTGLVRHVDVRHKGPNTTNGTVTDPTIWVYA